MPSGLASSDLTRRRSPGGRRPALVARPHALVGVAALAVVAIIYQPWSGRLQIPWHYGSDNFAYAIFVRNLQWQGSYHLTDSLGAPWSQDWYAFPQGGNRLHHIAWRLIGLLIDDPFTVLNVHFVLASAVIAIVAFDVLMRFGVASPMAAAMAVVYAFLPYRFWHGLQHPTLSAYFSAPLAVLLALWIANGRFVEILRVWRRGDRRRAARLLVAPLVVVVIVGSTEPYYTIFGAILAVLVGATEAINRRRWASIVAGVVVAVALGAVLAINLVPETLYRLANGANDRATERTPAESEGYALHLTQMVLPDPDHRVSALASYGEMAREVPAPGEGGTSLAGLATTGAIISIGSVLGLVRAQRPTWMRLQRLGVWQLALVLVATVGGGGFTLATLGVTQIRAWGRLVVFIAFLALVSTGLVLSGLARRIAGDSGRSRSFVLATLAVVVGVVGLLDAIPAGVRPTYEAARATRDSDQAFVDAMEDALPRRAMVFQLPVVPFPESRLNDMGSSDHARPYLLGDDRLRWSFGGFKGSVSDWQEVWTQETDARRFLDGIAATGFVAVYVDTWGYGDDATALDARLTAIIGAPAGVSDDGRMHWYDLRPLAAELSARLGTDDVAALGSAVKTLVRVDVGDGISGVEDGDGMGPVRWLAAEGRLRFPNFGAEGRQVIVRADLIGEAGATLHARGAGIDETITLTGGPDRVEWRLTLPSGNSELVLTTDAEPAASEDDGDGRRVRLVGLSTTDAVVERVLGPA